MLSNSEVDRVEILDFGVELCWLYNRKIVVFKVPDVRRDTIDIWGNTFLNIIQKWPAEKPLMSVHDFSPTKNVSFTPYIRSKAQKFNTIRSDLKGRTAIILPKSIISQVVTLFLRSTRNLQSDRNVFYIYEEGLTWVKEGLAKFNEN